MYLPLVFVLLTAQLGQGKPTDDASRIYNGHVAGDTQFPYMVTMYKPYMACSASMLNPTTVLTAGHCVVTKPGHVVVPVERVWISYGSIDYEKSTKVKVKKIVPHPNYGVTSTMDDDVALLLTGEPLPSTVAHIALPPQMHEFPIGTEVVEVGWGYVSPDGAPHNVLRFTKSKLISNEKCYLDKGTHNWVSRMCAAKVNSSGVCPGDSGGPMVLKTESGDVAIGIASYLVQNCFHEDTGLGAIFTRVSFYTDWIKEHADGDVKIIDLK